MSQLEVAKNVIYSVSITVVAGKFAPATAANFNGSSQLLSIVRTVVGGTAGVPVCAIAQPSGAGASAVYGLGLYSSSATDTSTYVVYWRNEYIQSQQYIAGTNATLGAGVQYAP